MATTTTRRKKEAVPAAASMERLAGDFNTAGKQLVILDYIRHRDAGLRVTFDEWAAVAARMHAADKVSSPSRMLAGYAATFEIPEDEQTEILIGYITLLADEAGLAFGDYLAALFPDAAPFAAAAPEAAPAAVPAAATEAAPEPAAEPAPAAAEAAPAAAPPKLRTGAKPGTRTDPPPGSAPRTRRAPGTAAKPPEAVPLAGRRVAYKTGDGKVIYAVCVQEHGDAVDVVDDKGDSWTNIKKALVKLDDGPIVWTITKAQHDMIAKMTKPGRGLWPDREEHDVLFELTRRVAPDKLCVVTVHNADPQPYVDAYVYDEAPAEGEINTPFEHVPPDDIAADYTFEVPGVGTIPAQVVVVAR
jgi:hypothetical protein